MNLATFSVHHDSNRESFLLVEPPDATDNTAVPIASAVTHVQPRDVHASLGERFQLLEPARRRSDRADQLRPPRAPESILLQLSFRNRIDVYPGRIRRNRRSYDGSLLCFDGASAVRGEKDLRRV